MSKETARESESHVLGWGPYPWAASMGFRGRQTARSKFLSQRLRKTNRIKGWNDGNWVSALEIEPGARMASESEP